MTYFIACPECGDIQEVENTNPVDCVRCRAQGHLYRMMSAPELLISAESNAREGYDYVADKRRGIALNLARYNAINECIRVASNEYSEAQREGLDSHAAHECAMDGMAQLLRNYDQILPQVAE